MMKLLSNGAEAVIYQSGKHVYKHRKVKSYRYPELDKRLRYERMHREANLLEKLHKAGFSSPKLIGRDEEQAMLAIQFLEGPRLRDVLGRQRKRCAKEIGRKIAFLHQQHIIHGDLTTSNMILHNKQVYFIDFGLSFVSRKVEDKAVDLHELRQALEAKHSKIWKQCYKEILAAYRHSYPDASAVLARLPQVEQRGRYRSKAASEISR